MQNRNQPAVQDRQVGNLGPEKAYAFIDGVRVAFDVGALGFGANGTISKSGSLTTAITVEGFCSLLSLIVAVHEIVNVCGQQCMRRDGRVVESTSHTATEYSTYIFFRMTSIVASFVGMALVAADLGAETTTVKSTIGIVAISLGIFASRALSSTRHKATEIVLQDDGGDIEMGRAGPPPAPPAPALAQRHGLFAHDQEEIPLIAVARPADAPAPAMQPAEGLRPNQFHQPELAAQGPAVPQQRAAVKKGRYVKRARPAAQPVVVEAPQPQIMNGQ